MRDMFCIKNELLFFFWLKNLKTSIWVSCTTKIGVRTKIKLVTFSVEPTILNFT
jgi:hypothetical protein